MAGLLGDVDRAPAPWISGASPELIALVAALFGPAQYHFTPALRVRSETNSHFEFPGSDLSNLCIAREKMPWKPVFSPR